MTNTSMHDYARVGAVARLAEIQTEIAAIRSAFPELEEAPERRRGRPKAQAVAPQREAQRSAIVPKPVRTMSAAARKAISRAQKKRWAAQRATAAATVS